MWPKDPLGRFFVQGRHPDEGPEHPYGQWSLVVEPFERVEGGVLARAEYMAPEAPHERLKAGASIELFRGPYHVGTMVVVDDG